MTPLESLVACGTKLWLDSVDPDEIKRNRGFGATGATSNPIIIADLIQTGRFDNDIQQLLKAGHDDAAIAWAMTDKLVKDAQAVFEPVSKETSGNDGWVSFELDPLARRHRGQRARGRADEEVHRTRQEVVGRAQEPVDQGARDGGRASRRWRNWSRPGYA